MLDAIGVCPEEIFSSPVRLCGLPKPLSQKQIWRLAQELSARQKPFLSFLGAGAYEHHIPPLVWEIASRSEFLTGYTPYQPEASQGVLQVFYEFQSLMAKLLAMDVVNDSLYDGASALAEAVLMAQRLKPGKVLLPRVLHPSWRQTLNTLTSGARLDLEEIPFDAATGRMAPRESSKEISALVVAQPNFFGVIEEADELAAWARRHEALIIAVVNPFSLALLRPPGQWGDDGADIAVGDTQPLGIPLSFGGPYCGFLAAKKEHLRQMPGRLTGRTKDLRGQEGFVLTLQAREQHIRRGRATSNICTNQGLMVVANTLYLAAMGEDGLGYAAAKSVENTHRLTELLLPLGVRLAFDAPFFHEAAIVLPKPPSPLLEGLAEMGILGGFALGKEYPELEDAILLCATETKEEEDLLCFRDRLAGLL